MPSRAASRRDLLRGEHRVLKIEDSASGFVRRARCPLSWRYYSGSIPALVMSIDVTGSVNRLDGKTFDSEKGLSRFVYPAGGRAVSPDALRPVARKSTMLDATLAG